MSTPSVAPPTVHVRIVQAVSSADASGWHMAYEVCNDGPAPVWLVKAESLVVQLAPGSIELSHARAALQPGVQVFGYFAPAVAPLAAGACVQRALDIRWPCTLSLLWNAQPLANPAPGDYAVRVRVGFGHSPEAEAPQLGEPIDAAVLRWQHSALSAPVTLSVAPHPAEETAP